MGDEISYISAAFELRRFLCKFKIGALVICQGLKHKKATSKISLACADIMYGIINKC
jgi:hypothetical protein